MKTKYYVIGMQLKWGWQVSYHTMNWEIGWLTLLNMDTEYIEHSKN